MDFLSRMTQAIEYIEEKITQEIDHVEIAKITCCSAHQFGRIFTYVVGIPLSEYIRRRRLTLAALELQSGDRRVIDVALEYGYNSPDSFTRAFRELHGITPREACVFGARLRLFPRITFHITIRGDAEMEYRIEERPEIRVVGIVKNLGRWVFNPQGDTWQEKSGEAWLFWRHFFDGGTNEILRDRYHLYRPPFWQVGVTRTLETGEVILAIGAESDGQSYPELEEITVPASTWGVFTARGSLSQKEHPIGALMTRVHNDWFPSSGYSRSMDLELEVYGPGDTNSEEYTCEVWIPIKRA